MYINNNNSSSANRVTNNTSEEAKDNQNKKRLFPFDNTADLENSAKETKLATIDEQLESAIQSGNSQALSDLFLNYAGLININHMINNNGNTLLHMACGSGHIEIARILIQKYPDLVNKKYKGWTTLHYACENGHIEIARMLIEKYPSLVNERDENDWTALYLACRGGHIEIAKILITYLGDINAITAASNETCLDAIYNNYNDLDDDNKIILLKNIIDFILLENTIAIESENYLFLHPDIFDDYSEYISPNLRIIFKTLIDKIQNKSLTIDKPIYMIHKVVEFDDISKDRVNFIDNIDNIEKVINNFIIKQFKSVNNKAIANGFSLMITNLTTQDEQNLERKYSCTSNKSFTISWLKLEETFILKIDNINLSLFTNRVVKKHNLINNNDPTDNNNFKDISFIFR